MAILEDKKWNLAHIQNSFIVDQFCENVIHKRDQMTVDELADRWDDPDFDHSPEIRAFQNFDSEKTIRERSNTDRLLKSYHDNYRKKSRVIKSDLDGPPEIRNVTDPEEKSPGKVPTVEEIKQRIEKRKREAIGVSDRIVEELPKDVRPFAEYDKLTTVSLDVPSLSYSVSLYKMIANKKVQLRFPNDKGEQMQEITINIRQNQKYRDLVGLTCFQYIKCYDHPEFKGPKLEHSEVTDRSHSIYFVENGNIEPDVTIHIAQDLKSAAFDLKSLAEEKINGRMTMANIGLAIVENCISERAKVGKTRVILSEIQMNRPTCQDVIVPIDTESTAEYVLLTAKSTFDEHGLQKLRPDQSFVLRKDNVILAPSIAILEFLQHNYRNPQIPDPVYTINLCIQTVEPPPKPPTFTEEQCSFAVKIIPSVMQSFKLGKKLQIAQDFTITFGNDCITIATGKPKATFKNRMTPTKLFAGIPSVIPYNKMSDFTIMPQKNERIQLTVAYKSDAAFERLVIRAPSDIGQRMHHFFEKNGVPHQSTSPSLASSRQKGRRKSVFF